MTLHFGLFILRYWLIVSRLKLSNSSLSLSLYIRFGDIKYDLDPIKLVYHMNLTHDKDIILTRIGLDLEL